MSGPVTPGQVEAYWAHRRAKEHLALVGFIHVALLAGAVVAFFAGGDPGRVVTTPLLIVLAAFSAVGLVRAGVRVISTSRRATP